MGACDSSDYDKSRKQRCPVEENIPRPTRERQKSTNSRNINPEIEFKSPDDYFNQIEEPELDNRDDILRRGNKKELQIMVDNYPDDINE